MQILKRVYRKADRKITEFLGVKSRELRSLELMRTLAQKRAWNELGEIGRKVLARNPHQSEVMSLLAYSLQQQGLLKEASDLAIQATTFNGKEWLSQFVAGAALRGLGEEKAATAYLRCALALYPSDPQTLRQFIGAVAASNGLDSAAREYGEHCRGIGVHSEVLVAPIHTVTDWIQRQGLSLFHAGEVEQIPFRAPNVLGNTLRAEVIYAPSNKPYVAEISNARIFGNSSLILTSDGKVLNDSAAHPEFGRFVSMEYEAAVLAQEPGRLLLDTKDFPVRKIEAGIFLGGLASNAFGHWFPEFLPKLEFFKTHPEFEKMPIIVDAGMPQTHFELLRRLANNPLILLQAGESIVCRRLLVAPTPAFAAVELLRNPIPVEKLPGLSPRALRYLRGRLRTEQVAPPQKRLFLARKKMKWRRLLNEGEIEDDLKRLGFEIVFTEDLTISAQIELFGNAEWIVAPNGSALLNLIFCDPTKVKLIVLMQPKLFNWGTFQGPMGALGYQSVCVCGEFAVARDQKHSDYSISLPMIREALVAMGFEGR
jgi:hypothetical protein